MIQLVLTKCTSQEYRRLRQKHNDAKKKSCEVQKVQKPRDSGRVERRRQGQSRLGIFQMVIRQKNGDTAENSNQASHQGNNSQEYEKHKVLHASKHFTIAPKKQHIHVLPPLPTTIVIMTNFIFRIAAVKLCCCRVCCNTDDPRKKSC